MRRIPAATLVALAVLASACTSDSGNGGDLNDARNDDGGGCAAVDVAVSSEKIDLLTDLATRFNDSGASKSGDGCVRVSVRSKASGAATQLLADGWPDEAANGPRPEAWSPASTSWTGILNQRLADRGEGAMAPASKPFMLTPLVIAMPKPMADALGYPQTPVGWADILTLSRDPEGWGGKGHPEWGAFKLGKTNPNFSTSALSATIAQFYAATGKDRGLSLEDLARPDVDAFARGVESSVVHYGDITMTFLNNWFRNDVRGTALTYVSAVAIEEKSVIDYNRGNPDGVLDPGEKPRTPRVPLVAVYPKEGTLFSDNPFVVLDAPWVTPAQKAGARAFERFIQEPANQRRVLAFGFRPGNPSVGVGAPITKANGVDSDQPAKVLEVPDPPVLVRLLDLWAQQRKGARVLLVVDVSGSMGEQGDDEGNTKLDLAKNAAIRALEEFKGDDLVGLRIFSTGIAPKEPTDYLDLVPIGPIAEQRELIQQRIRSLVPTQGTPLYTVTRDSYTQLREQFDAARINAVVLLTDGRNEDDRNTDLTKLLSTLRAGSEGQSTRPVRVFTIAYGADADQTVLRRVAEATNAAAYDASDPATIDRVFTAVISNF